MDALACHKRPPLEKLYNLYRIGYSDKKEIIFRWDLRGKTENEAESTKEKK